MRSLPVPPGRNAWLAIAVLASLLSGCGTYERTSLVSTGPGADLDAGKVADFRRSQDAVLVELIVATRAPDLPASAASALAVRPPEVARPVVAAASAPDGYLVPGTPDVTWDQVIRAGMDYLDARCEAYLHALYRLDRDKKTAVAQTGLLGSATAGVQAAVGTAAKEVAIAAILFGLAGSTIDNLASNLLYELEPSSVRALVKAQQTHYRDNLGTGYRDRPGAMAALRGYAVLCVPANIEAEVNLAVKRTEPEATKADPANGRPPVVTNSSIAVSTVSFGPDEISARLDAFVNPGGRMNPDNERRLLDYMEANGIARNTGTTSFIFGKQFQAARKDAAKHFGLI